MRPIGWQVVESAGDEKAIVPRTVRLSTRRSTSAHREEFSPSVGVATLTRIVPSREPLVGEETARPAMRLRLGGVRPGRRLFGIWYVAQGGTPLTGKGPAATCGALILNTVRVAVVGPSRTVAKTTLPSGCSRNTSSKYDEARNWTGDGRRRHRPPESKLAKACEPSADTSRWVLLSMSSQSDRPSAASMRGRSVCGTPLLFRIATRPSRVSRKQSP